MSVACIGHKYHHTIHIVSVQRQRHFPNWFINETKKKEPSHKANISNSIQIVSVYVYYIAFISTTFGIARSVWLAAELKGQWSNFLNVNFSVSLLEILTILKRSQIIYTQPKANIAIKLVFRVQNRNKSVFGLDFGSSQTYHLSYTC